MSSLIAACPASYPFLEGEMSQRDQSLFGAHAATHALTVVSLSTTETSSKGIIPSFMNPETQWSQSQVESRPSPAGHL